MVMKRKKNSLLLGLMVLLSVFSLFGQRKMTRSEYIDLYKDVAIEKMHTYGIPASITLAQGILESGCGSSDLAIKANNHFGIKCHKEWSGKTFTMDDDEKNECFRKYDDPADSYRDHSLFLTTRERYSGLFTLKSTDYKGWAQGLKKAGYATNPQYPQLLIKIIEEENLHQYDLVTPKDLTNSKKGKKIEAETEVPPPNIAEPNLPDPSTYMVHKQCSTTLNGRPIYINNGVKYVIADAGENLYSIAQEFGIYSYQLFQYNEKSQKEEIHIGDPIYIQPKKKKGEQTYYTVLEGETLPYISQKLGITLKSLCKKNGLSKNDQVAVGTQLWLQETKK